MKREEFIKAVSSKLKLIRTEYGITQEAMSEMLGISKKTLVETEKGRRELSWTEVIAVASVFEKSEVKVWECRNCGHIMVGTKAPEICPVCAHPLSFFEIHAENY